MLARLSLINTSILKRFLYKKEISYTNSTVKKKQAMYVMMQREFIIPSML